jgi:hypothetical protein
MKSGKSTIHRCPCGDEHLVSGGIAQRITTRGPTLPVLNKHGAWYVPCVFAVVHGIDSDAIRDAAEQYGFDPVRTLTSARRDTVSRPTRGRS